MRPMLIERFKDGDAKPIGERFRRDGRMLPEGVIDHASWVDLAGFRCFQLMAEPSPESLAAWTSRWDDLVAFAIVPVLTSADFWSKVTLESAHTAAIEPSLSKSADSFASRKNHVWQAAKRCVSGHQLSLMGLRGRVNDCVRHRQSRLVADMSGSER
jgi:hypothetical protein